MRKVIDELITKLDSDTITNRKRNSPLMLMGDVDRSPFLRSIIRKAEQLGIECVVTTTNQFSNPVIVDRETCDVDYVISELDVDHLFHDGMSCVAEAILLLLGELDLIAGKDITIVGRGHAVKGLAQELIDSDATVTVAHSQTKSLLHATKGKDVVIYATPEIDTIIGYDTNNLVIDLSGCIRHAEWFYCDYLDSIGKLTVSVLLNRFVRCFE